MMINLSLDKKLIPLPEIGQVYSHYKDINKLYTVLAIAVDVDDKKSRIIYQNIQTLDTFSRGLENFRELLLISDKEYIPRFKLIP